MITLRDFLDLSMDTFYKINLFFEDDLQLRQVEVGDIEEELEKMGKDYIMDETIGSWDIDDTTKEFCINM